MCPIFCLDQNLYIKKVTKRINWELRCRRNNKNAREHTWLRLREIDKQTRKNLCSLCPSHLLPRVSISALQEASSPWHFPDTYPWIPEELCKHHQVRSRQRQAHVCSSEGQNSHRLLLWQLELLAQRLPLSWRGGAINADIFNTLRKGGWKRKKIVLSSLVSPFLSSPSIF